MLKNTARQRAQYFLKVFAPELTEEASRIVDEAVKIAEIELLGWTNEEAAKAWGQACLDFAHGGHDMLPRSEDRYLLYFAAWLEAMDEGGDEDRPESLKISAIQMDTTASWVTLNRSSCPP